MQITIRNKYLIMAVWGPRRVTSSKRYQEMQKSQAYPLSITANHRVFIAWAVKNIPRWLFGPTYIVLPETKAQARIDAQLFVDDQNDQISLSEGEISQLLAKRDAARRAKDFALADAIRDDLRSAGVDVQDRRSVVA